METSTKSAGEQPMAIRLLLAGGAIGPLLFIVVFLIEGATRPHYSVWQDAVSALSLGEGGWMQITNFIVCGALVLGFSIVLRRALRTGRGSTWGPILLGIYGLTFIVIGPILPDPSLGYPPGASSALTTHGAIHILFGLLQFASLIAACLVLARRDAALERRGWSWYSVATGLLVAASYVAFVLTARLLDGGPTGLIERIGIIGGGIWIVLLAIRLMSRSVPRVSAE